MERMASSDDGSNLSEKDENEEPPSPIFFNSSPPSMVAFHESELKKSDLQGYFLNWNQKERNESIDFVQRATNNSHNYEPFVPMETLTSSLQQRQSTSDRPHYPSVFCNSLRAKALYAENTTKESPYPAQWGTLPGMSLAMPSAATSSTASTSAASLAEKERAKNAAATVAFLAGFRQAAIAAAVASTSKTHHFPLDNNFTGKLNVLL